MSNSQPSARSQDTRERLLRAGVRVFAELGFEAASTRQLASQAGVNLAAIPYHFDSKKGLYLAVASYVADQIEARMLPALGQTQHRPDDDDARDILRDLQHRMIELVAGEPEADAWAGFILREQAQPTEAFDILYERTMGRLIAMVVQLLAQLTDSGPDNPQLRLRAIALMGQILIFRTSRAGVLRTLGWEHYDQQRIDEIKTVVDLHTDRLIAGLEGQK